MIVVRTAAERHYQKEPGQDSWLSFGPSGEPALGTFGNLVVFRERKLLPRVAAREPGEEAVIITYVRKGSLAFEDSLGHTGVLRRGEFQLMTAGPGPGLGYREMNVSPVHEAHVFQIWLRPEKLSLAPRREQRRFSVAERKGRLCLIASEDGAERSLKLHQDAILYSGLFDAGQVVVYALSRERGVWLHFITGSVRVGLVTLEPGDGAGISDEAEVHFVAQEPSEVLLLDLGHFRTQALLLHDAKERPSDTRLPASSPSLIVGRER